MSSPRPRLPYMPALDGLRAVAVLAVFFYHADFLWAAGGFLGVESFFVISGFLITALLLREWQQSGGLRLSRFWLRRARRLLPALWLVLLIVPPLTARFAPDALPRVREDVGAALVYLTNWVYIGREIPYFEQFARPPLLRHLWSLAVEEQFYLLWPLTLWGLLRLGKGRRKALSGVVIVLALLSTAEMVLLYNPLADPARVYYGTDTRAAGFLVGAALALLWPPRGEETFSPRLHALLDGFGWAALGVLLFLFARLDEFSPLLYRGGFLLTALTTAALVGAGAHSRRSLTRFLSLPPMRWVGTRSYSIYLWHWPLMALFRLGFECAWPPAACLGFHALATALLAEGSYRLVEKPIRRDGFRAWGRVWRLRWRRWQPARRWGSALLAALLLAAAGSGWWPQTASGSAESLSITRPPVSPARTASPTPLSPRVSATPPPQAVTAATPPAALVVPTPIHALPSPSPSPTASPLELTLLGDSVMESTLPLWEDTLGGLFWMEAAPKRRMEDAPPLIEALAAEGHLAPRVVVHLGTNRPFEAAAFDAVMESLLAHGARQVWFVNVRRPVRWEYTVNKRLAEGVARWPQASLVDWYALSDGKEGWFVDDKTHLSYYGARAYVDAILEAVEGGR